MTLVVDRRALLKPQRKLSLPSRRKVLRGLAATGIAAPFVVRPDLAEAYLLFMAGQNQVPTVYSTKRRSLVFVGNSITWGFGLTRAQGWPYQLQAQVDSHQGHGGTGWEWRAIQSDDYSTIPFNGGYSGTLLLTPEGSISPEVVGPFSNYVSGSDSGYSNYTAPALGFNTSTSNGIVFSAGTATTYLVTLARLFSGSTPGLLNIYAEGTALPVASITVTSTTPTVFVSLLSASPSGSGAMSVYYGSGADVDVIGLHPTTIYSSNQVLVEVVARNSFCLSDYNASDIQYQSLFTPNRYGSSDTTPIYVLIFGTVEMYDANRAISGATYESNLSTMVSNLLAGSIAPPAANGIVLTIPMLPDPSASPVSPATVAGFRTAVLTVATQYGLGVIDLQNLVPASWGAALTIANGFYQSGQPFHPTASGATTIYNVLKTALNL